MKKLIYILSCLFFLTFISTTTTSCKTGEGCEAEEAYEKGQGKKLSTKRGKSRLFKNKKS
jgi:hypothetical protein